MSNMLKRFEETAARYPDKKAVAYKDTYYTFREMKLSAEKLGRTIAAVHTAENPVIVLTNRGADTAVLFLAVLYSGSYYVPIDPEMPVAKIRMILSDSQADVLLAGEENKELLDELDFKGTTLYMEEIHEGSEGEEWSERPEISEDMPMYMIYTSGSTGKPKGVLKSHGAVYSFIQAYAGTFGLGSDEIIGNQTPFFFDASAKDLYLSLFTGATLEILPSELFIFPVTLIEYMNARHVSYICWVPTALALVTQMNTFKKVLPQTLKKVFFVGEVFPVKQLQKWMQTLPELQYVNLYGSTEIAGICCYYELRTGEIYDTLPVGRPLKNCRVFLLGEHGIVQEQGQVGELCVSSRALAMEYYHDPEKTAAVFEEMRLPDGSMERVLKTGDLAHYDEDGNLVFVSRKDFQIKHMGRRIELGEIEAAADRLSETQRVCCLYDAKKKKIVLFCELVQGSTAGGKDILHLLRDRLSAYMLPGKVIVLDKLPLSANGKIDRVKLKERM